MTAKANTASRLAKATTPCGVKVKRPERDARKPPKPQPRVRPLFASEVDSSCATAALMRERRTSDGTLRESSGPKAVAKKAFSFSASASDPAHAGHAAM